VRVVRRCGLHTWRLKTFQLSHDVDNLIVHNKTRTAGRAAQKVGHLRVSGGLADGLLETLRDAMKSARDAKK
jgi:hypothetical protein